LIRNAAARPHFCTASPPIFPFIYLGLTPEPWFSRDFCLETADRARFCAVDRLC
jgi:hypothetical protein